MIKLTLYLATQNLPFEGSSLKVKLGEQELGTTEVQSGRGGIFEKTFPIEHDEGGEAEGIWIDVRDQKGTAICSRSFAVADILSANKCRVKSKKVSGGGILVAHLSSETPKGELSLRLAGERLKNVDGIFGVSDPMFEIVSLDEESGRWRSRYRSEFVKNDLNPRWKDLSVDLAKLCGGDLDRRLRIMVYDIDEVKSLDKQRLSIVKKTEVQSMGYAETSARKLLEGGRLQLLFKGEDFGRIIVEEARLVGYKDPRETVVKIMDAVERSELAWMDAECSRAALKRAEEALEEAEAELRRAEAGVSEANDNVKEAGEDIERKDRALAEAQAALDEMDLGE